MESITGYLLPGGIIVIVILFLSGLHLNHLFIWMDPEVVAHDKLIAGKVGYLNTPFFLARAIFFLGGWSLYRFFSRKFSLAQDKASDFSNHKKNFRISAAFLVFFIVTESIMSWDWIMSIDPHWFSTLFGWYVFASMVVSGVTAIALIISAYQKIEASSLSVYEYFFLIFAAFWGWVLWSQTLTLEKWIGIVLIVVAGVIINAQRPLKQE